MPPSLSRSALALTVSGTPDIEDIGRAEIGVQILELHNPVGDDHRRHAGADKHGRYSAEAIARQS
jgi:hypothetical protein